MKLSDIRGARALDIIADAMELAEVMADDPDFKAFGRDLKALADKDDAWRVFCKHVPKMLRNKEYNGRIISILAAAADVPVEEYAKDGDVITDLFELITSDAGALGFLAGSVSTAE